MSELVGPIVHRRLARPFIRVFVATGIEPVIATAAGLLACLAAGVLYALDVGAATIAGGALVLFGATLDCVDGGAAAATRRVTPLRSWLDTMADRIGDTAIVLGVTAGAASATASNWIWPLGAASAVAMVLSSYARKEYALLFGAPYAPSLLDRLARRDVRTFAIFVGSLALRPFWVVVTLGAISLSAVVAAGVRAAREGGRTPA